MWPSTVVRFAPIVPTEMGRNPAVRRVYTRAQRRGGDVATPGLAPCRNVAGPLVVAATVLLDRLKSECAVIAAERGQFGFDLRLDLDCLSLRPASEQKPVTDPGRSVERGLAGTT